MKGKIIALAISFALGFTAIFFSVRQQSTFTGNGSGKNTAINSAEEFAEILTQVPYGYEYYEMAQQAKVGRSAGSVAAAEDSTVNSPRSLTLKDKLISEEETSSSISSGGDGVRVSTYNSTTNRVFQDMTVYFAKDGVYYDVEYSCYDNTRTTENTNSSTSVNGVINTQTEVITNTYTEFEFDFYVGVHGAFLRYNKYNIVTETTTYLNYEKQESDETGEIGQDEKIRQLVTDCIQSNYGKWINVLYNPGDGLENFDPETADGSSDLMVKFACVEIGSMLVKQMIGVADADTSTLARLSRFVKLAGTNSNDYYDKSGSVYKMTPYGRYELLSMFGYTLPEGVNDYKTVTPVRQSSFVFDLTDKTSPAMYLDYDFSTSSSIQGYGAVYESMDIQEEVVFTNIDNTVTPKIGSSKTLYAYLGKAVKKLLEDIDG